MRKKKQIITLDNQTRKRIVELLEVRDDLIRHRNSNLSGLAVIFYGLAVGCGFVSLMSVAKTGALRVALALAPLLVVSLWVARKLDKAKESKVVKIRLR